MPDARPQTRAFLFADLRGYSAYTERHGDRAAEALIDRYRQLVRAQISTFHGAEIRTEGDSFYVVFDSVAVAVEAALAISHAARAATEADGGPIAVGIGIHAGESRDGEHGIVSSAVNIAARVCSVAPGGQVLVTETVRSLVRTALPLNFTPVGRRRLKGITEPLALYRVNDTATERGRRSPLPFVVGSAALALALGVALLAGRAPESSRPGAAATSPRAAAAAPSAAKTHDLSRFTDRGEFPNDAEQELLERLPATLADSCERADVADAPEFRFRRGEPLYDPDVPDFPLAIRAGLSCLKDGVRVHYWHAPQTRQALRPVDLFFHIANRLSITEGNCETASRVYQPWSAGLHSGHVLCYVSADGEATMHWTFDGPGIYAIASRREAETQELYEWWADTGRRLGR
ncbi:MAG TPA: adenylate/guanylate cyclase domain-containing protein [Dehalococcoidia bacterium]|nr:adenylate/guanylate cyclase domain-containing protein [Dehalococcoidia bacterium]